MAGLFQRKKPVPTALERSLKSEQGRHKDIRLARLDFLYRAYVQFHEFGKALLRHFAMHPLTADICTEGGKLLLLEFYRHAPLGRLLQLTTTARWGVK